MSRNYKPIILTAFAIGAGLGAAAALLLAPKSGEELRDDIADGVNDGIRQVRGKSREIGRRAQAVVDAAKDNVQDALDAGDRAYAQAAKKS